MTGPEQSRTEKAIYGARWFIDQHQVAAVLEAADFIDEEQAALLIDRFADLFATEHGLRFDREAFTEEATS